MIFALIMCIYYLQFMEATKTSLGQVAEQQMVVELQPRYLGFHHCEDAIEATVIFFVKITTICTLACLIYTHFLRQHIDAYMDPHYF